MSPVNKTPCVHRSLQMDQTEKMSIFKVSGTNNFFVIRNREDEFFLTTALNPW